MAQCQWSFHKWMVKVMWFVNNDKIGMKTSFYRKFFLKINICKQAFFSENTLSLWVGINLKYTSRMALWLELEWGFAIIIMRRKLFTSCDIIYFIMIFEQQGKNITVVENIIKESLQLAVNEVASLIRKNNILERIVLGDKTLIYYRQPDSKNGVKHPRPKWKNSAHI